LRFSKNYFISIQSLTSFTKYIIKKKIMASPKFESLIKYIIKKKMMAFPKFESFTKYYKEENYDFSQV